ncbi:MAG: hypothetical protein K0R28_4030 [Paenibacillus sp.]|nr:hypothetical protein [Paenibacillus sp.]
MFADSKGEFAVSITVEEKQSADLSPVGLIRKALAKSGDTVLEKQYVERGEGSYAKIVGKTSSGSYYETRAFLKGSNIYYALLYVQSEENYKNSFKQNTYLDLLDSFRLTFDASDEALKDISVYKDGDTSYTNEYGLTFELPSDWSEDEYSDEPSYSNKDHTLQAAFRVTSASSGDTLDAWTEREQKRFADSYAEGSRKVVGWHEFELNGGIPAKENRYSAVAGEDWETRHSIYFIKDKYKYEIDLTYSEQDGGSELEDFLRKFKASLSVSKDDINTSLGFIQDEHELLDPDRTVTLRNAKYKYSVKIPEAWESVSGYYGSEGESDVAYAFTGGMFEIESDDRARIDDVVEELEQSYKKSSENDGKFKYEVADATVFELPAKKFDVEYKKKKAPYKETVYVFAKGDIVYTVTMRLEDAANTEANASRLEQAFRSIAPD